MAGDIDPRRLEAHIRGVDLDPRDFAPIPDLATIAAEGLKLAEGGLALCELLRRAAELLEREVRNTWSPTQQEDREALLADIRRALG